MDVNILEKNIDTAVGLLKAFSNEKRLLILCYLYKQELCVGDLEKKVGLSQSALSQHLARLRRDGLVQTRRDAQTIYYSLGHNACGTLMQCLYDLYCVPVKSDIRTA